MYQDNILKYPKQYTNSIPSILGNTELYTDLSITHEKVYGLFGEAVEDHGMVLGGYDLPHQTIFTLRRAGVGEGSFYLSLSPSTWISLRKTVADARKDDRPSNWSSS